MLHFALPDQLAHGAGDVLDRDVRINAVFVVGEQYMTEQDTVVV